MSDLHRHLTDRVTRGRLALEARRAARPAIIVLIGAAVGVLALGYILMQVGSRSLRSTHELRVLVADARGVVPGRNDVRIKGISAGTITDVSLEHGRPVLTISVESSYGPLYADARAQLRPQTPLQDMYLDFVDRGTPRAGKLTTARPLAEANTKTSVNVADVMQAFSPAVRTHLATVLDQLGNGLDDRGAALREAFAALVPTLSTAQTVARQLGTRDAATRRLVHNMRLLTGELARRDQQVRQLVRDGGATLRTIAAHRGDLEQTLAELPGTITGLDRGLGAVSEALPQIDRAMRALSPLVAELPRALTNVRALSADAAPAVRALQRPVGRLTPLARVLRPLSADLSRATAALRPQVGAVDHATTSAASCTTAIQRFFQWTPSVFKLGDQRGPGPRADATFGVNTSAFVKEPREVRLKNCAGGSPVGGRPGPGGTRQREGGAR